MNEPVPFDAPAVERGLGFFETVLVAGGRAVLWEPHVSRILGTLSRLELPAPTREGLEAAAREALSPTAGTSHEQALRLSWIAVGADIESEASWRLDASVRQIPESTLRRRAGSHAITLPPDLSRDSPGHKSTSYCAAMLGLRLARRRGGDEGLFVSGDGSYLEGCSTALAVFADGGFRISEKGALPSVTAAAFLGDSCQSGRLLEKDVRAGALLLGSLTKAVPVLSLDGRACEVPDAMRAAAEGFNERLFSLSTPLV